MLWREAPVTVALTAATLLVSLLILLAGVLPQAAFGFGFLPARLYGVALPPEVTLAAPAWLTPLTATFVHGGLLHIAFNLVMLGYCGAQTERAIGSGGFLVLYGIGAYAAALAQWGLSSGAGLATPMIGASGAISAIVAAYALLYGERRAKRVGPFPADLLHVLWLAAAWIGIQLLISVAGFGGMPGQAIAIGAHIGGFLAGLALARPLLLWRYRRA